MSTHFIVSIVAVLVLTLTISACHHKSHRHSSVNDERAIKHLAKKLELDSQQRIELKSILATVSELKEQKNQMHQEWESYVRNSLTDNVNDQTDANEFSTKQAEKTKVVSMKFVNAVSRIKEVLNEDQEVKLIALLDRHSKRNSR